MKTKIITNRSQLGYGYTGNNNEEILYPDYTGTIKQISECIDGDRNIKSFNSGNVYWKHKWFVRYNKKWYRVVKSSENISYLLDLWVGNITVEFE